MRERRPEREESASKMPFVNDVNWKKLIKLDFVRSKNNAAVKPPQIPLPAGEQLQSSDTSISKGAKADKMFLNSELFSKYLALDSSIIHQGHLRVGGLKDSQRLFENCFLVLKKCAKKTGIYLFGFEDQQGNRAPPRFILNVNNVQKVDYKESDKSIHLTSQAGESCILKSDDLKTLNAWINVIVDKCEFNQEEVSSSVRPAAGHHRLPPLPEISLNEASKPLPIKNGHSRSGPSLQSSHTSHSLNTSRTQAMYCSNINSDSSKLTGGRKNRNIAGQAASSVGSMQEHLFRTSSKNSLGTLDSNNNSLLVDQYNNIKSKDGQVRRKNSSFETNYSADDSSEHMNHDCDGYINLDDCESGGGGGGNAKSSSPSHPPNKHVPLQYKSQSTDILNQPFHSSYKPKPANHRNAFYSQKASDSYEDEDDETDYSSFRFPQSEATTTLSSSQNHLTLDQRARNKRGLHQDYMNTGPDLAAAAEAPRTIRYVPLEVIASKPSLDTTPSHRNKTAKSSKPTSAAAMERNDCYVDLDSQKTKALKNAIQPAHSPY